MFKLGARMHALLSSKFCCEGNRLIETNLPHMGSKYKFSEFLLTIIHTASNKF